MPSVKNQIYHPANDLLSKLALQLVRWGLLLLVAAGCTDQQGDSTEPAVATPGKLTYQRYCFSCHAAGIAGAPKVGVATDWGARRAKGLELLLANTKVGVPPGMPAMGLCRECSDQDLRDVINYMTDNSQE